MRIIKNCIRCNVCGDIIVSEHHYDYKRCKCGAVAVDGGRDYMRRVGKREDWEELSITDPPLKPAEKPEDE